MAKMSTGKIYNFVILSLLLICVATAVVLYDSYSRLREQNAESLLDESKLAYRIDKLEAERQYKREYYYRLVHDDDFAERVIREKLGYVGQNEIVFRFKDSTPLGAYDAKPRQIAPKPEEKKAEQAAAISPAPETDSNADSPAEQKSFLRKLFSREKPAEEAPRLKTDSVEPAAQASAQVPAQSQPAETKEKNAPIRLPEFKQSAPAQSQTSPQAETAAHAPKKLPPRTPNSIRFRAD